jgi:exonuclease SbcD
MRFLHTSDWHIGKPLRHHKREGEHAAALAEVLDIAKQESIDCLLVAGDIFESVAPQPESERIFFDFLRELVGERISAVIVGGNHDHPRRLAAYSRVLDLVDVHLRGESVRAEEGGVIEVLSRDKSTRAIIATLPWVPERKAREWATLAGGGSEHFTEYAQEVGGRMADLAARFTGDTVNLMVAHVFLSGAVVAPDSGERPLHVGEIYAVSPQQIPSEVQYAALGHVHNPRQPKAFELANAYYSGSLLQCDFGEAGQQKCVNIVDVSPGRKADVRPVPLTSIRQLRNLGSHKEGLTLDELKAEADGVGDAYLKVFLKADRPVPGLAQQVREILPNAVDIHVSTAEHPDDEPEVDVQRETPGELFTAYYRGLHATEPPEDLMRLFRDLYEEVAPAAPSA